MQSHLAGTDADVPRSYQGLLCRQSAADVNEDDEAQCAADLLPT